MADKNTVEKVKELLDGHCYGPLKEAAEKWLAIADEKFDVKDKADKVMDKLNDAADAYAEASEKFNAKLGEAGDKINAAAEKFGEKNEDALGKISDVTDKLTDKAEELTDKIGDKVSDASEKLALDELIKQLKEGVATVSDNIELFGSDKGAEIVGSKEAAEQIKKHAEELKAEGKTYCDCEACTKAREILKDLGEDIGE